MSLIQEALKRQAEEQPAVILPKMPVEPGEPPEDKKRPRPLQIITTALLATGLIAVLTGLGIYLIKPKTHSAAVKTPAPAASVKPPAAAHIPAAVPEKPVTANEPAKTEPVAVAPVKKKEPAPEINQAWPELKLTGIAQGESQSIAILNGKMLTAGRTLGDVTVKEVHNADVVVEYRGERRVLYLNE